MSDTLGSALIEISPDFSRFETELKSRLETALKKIESSSAATLKVEVQVASAAQATKSLRQVEQVSSDLSAQLTSVKETLVQVSNSIATAAKTMVQSTIALQQLAAASQKAAKDTSFLGRALETVGAIARFTDAITGTAANIVTITKFGSGLRAAFVKFGTDLADAAVNTDGFKNKLKSLSSAFISTFVSVEDQTKISQNFGRGLEGAAKGFGAIGNAAGTAGEKFVRFFGINRKANEEIVKTANIVKTVNFGPGTTSLNEFATRSEGIFKRFSIFAQQAFQNIRFHGANALETIRERVAPLGQRFDFLKGGIAQATQALTGFVAIGRVANATIPPIASGIGSLISKLQELSTKGGPAAVVLSTIGQKLLSLSPGALAGLAVAGITLVTAAFSKAIIGLAQKASNLQESVNAVSVLLGDASEPFKELIGDTTKLGITQLELNEAIAPIIPLLKDAGLGGDELAGKLNDLTRRAVDLGSIFNKTSGDVLVKLGAAIRGEIEPARALGISFNSLAVEQIALANGAEKVDGQFTEEAKTLARLQLVMEKSKDSAGDFANTQDSLANATRSFRSVLANLGVEFSKVFLPASEKITASLNKLATTAGPGLIRFFQTITPLVTEVGKLFSDVVIGGLGQAFVEASNLASTVFIPVLKAVVDVLRFLLQGFEALNIFLGKFLGGLNAATVALTGLLIIKQLTTLAFIFNGALRLVAFALNLLAAAAAKANLTQLSSGLTASAGAATNLTAHLKGVLGVVGLVASAILLLRTNTVDTTRAIEDLTIATDKDLGENFVKIVDDVNNSFGQKVKDFFLFAGSQVRADKRTKKAFEDLFAIDPDAARKVVQQLKDQGSAIADILAPELERLIALQEKRNATLNAGVISADAYAETEKKLAEAFGKTQTVLESFLSAAGAVDNANKSLASANKSLASATQAVRNIEAERLQVLRDTISPLQEVLDAEEALTRIGFRLRDLGQEQIDIQQQLIELRTPASADDLASADRAVERAKIALNKSIRAETEALAKLNEQQAVSVDLSGLSVDQIKSRLSNIRAVLATQRATKKETKSQEEIDEEATENRLNTLDAAQALRDAEQAREDIQNRVLLNAPAIRELEERLVELALDKADATVEQEGAQKRLNALKAGETTLARELTRLEEQKKAALEQQSTAQAAVTAAKEAVVIAAAEQDVIEARILGNKRLELEAEQRLLELKGLQVGLDTQSRDLLQQQLDSLKLQSAIPLRPVPPPPGPIPAELIGTNFANIAAGGGLLGGGLADRAIQALAEALIATQTLKNFVTPGGALARYSGGLVEGAPGAMGQLMHAGEFGWNELVLPYQRDPMRSANLLAKYAPEVVTLAAGSGPELVGANTNTPRIVRSRDSYVSPNKPSKLEQKMDRLIQLQVEANGKTFELNAPISVTSPDSQLAARRTAREIKRMLDNL